MWDGDFEDGLNTGMIDFYAGTSRTSFDGVFGMKAKKIVKHNSEIQLETLNVNDTKVKMVMDCDNNILEYWLFDESLNDFEKLLEVHLQTNCDTFYPCIAFGPSNEEEQKCIFVDCDC